MAELFEILDKALDAGNQGSSQTETLGSPVFHDLFIVFSTGEYVKALEACLASDESLQGALLFVAHGVLKDRIRGPSFSFILVSFLSLSLYCPPFRS